MFPGSSNPIQNLKMLSEQENTAIDQPAIVEELVLNLTDSDAEITPHMDDETTSHKDLLDIDEQLQLEYILLSPSENEMSC